MKNLNKLKEFLFRIKNKPAEYLLFFEYINTKKIENISDKELIDTCRISLVANGYGNLAELLKRFKKLTVNEIKV